MAARKVARAAAMVVVAASQAAASETPVTLRRGSAAAARLAACESELKLQAVDMTEGSRGNGGRVGGEQGSGSASAGSAVVTTQPHQWRWRPDGGDDGGSE